MKTSGFDFSESMADNPKIECKCKSRVAHKTRNLDDVVSFNKFMRKMELEMKCCTK